jgi:hypothetical protein
MKLRKGTPYKKRLMSALNNTPDLWSGRIEVYEKPEARKGRFVPSEVLCEYWPMGALIEGELIAETQKAILLRNGTQQWIAKSQIEGFSRKGIFMKVIIPEWLVDRNASLE